MYNESKIGIVMCYSSAYFISAKVRMNDTGSVESIQVKCGARLTVSTRQPRKPETFSLQGSSSYEVSSVPMLCCAPLQLAVLSL